MTTTQPPTTGTPSMPRTVMVRVTMTIPVDVDAWAAEYGTAPTAAAVRADVKRAVQSAAWAQLDGMLAPEPDPEPTPEPTPASRARGVSHSAPSNEGTGCATPPEPAAAPAEPTPVPEPAAAPAAEAEVSAGRGQPCLRPAPTDTSWLDVEPARPNLGRPQPYGRLETAVAVAAAGVLALAVAAAGFAGLAAFGALTAALAGLSAVVVRRRRRQARQHAATAALADDTARRYEAAQAEYAAIHGRRWTPAGARP